MSQTEFGFVSEVTIVKPWLRPAVLTLLRFKREREGDRYIGELNRVTYNAWLMWHAPLNGGVR